MKYLFIIIIVLLGRLYQSQRWRTGNLCFQVCFKWTMPLWKLDYVFLILRKLTNLLMHEKSDGNKLWLQADRHWKSRKSEKMLNVMWSLEHDPFGTWKYPWYHVCVLFCFFRSAVKLPNRRSSALWILLDALKCILWGNHVRLIIWKQYSSYLILPCIKEHKTECHQYDKNMNDQRIDVQNLSSPFPLSVPDRHLYLRFHHLCDNFVIG